MKVYIMTNCAAEHNHTPFITDDKEKAVQQMRESAALLIWQGYKEEIDDIVYDEGHNLVTTSGQKLYDIILEHADWYIDGIDVYENKISIYYKDDTYNNLEIFELEMNVSSAKEEALPDCP